MNDAEAERMQPDHGYAPGELPEDEATERERRRLLANWEAVVDDDERRRARADWAQAWRVARRLNGLDLTLSMGWLVDQARRQHEERGLWNWAEAMAEHWPALMPALLREPDFPKRPFTRGPKGFLP